MTDINKYVKDLIGTGLSDVTYSITRDLRRSAQSKGWPLDVVLNLRVAIDPSSGELSVEYPDRLADRVETLEYGTQDTPPNPVIRTFNNRVDDLAQQYTVNFEYEILDEWSMW